MNNQSVLKTIMYLASVLIIAGTIVYRIYSYLPIARDYVYLRRVELNNDIVNGCGELAASISQSEFIEPDVLLINSINYQSRTQVINI